MWWQHFFFPMKLVWCLQLTICPSAALDRQANLFGDTETEGQTYHSKRHEQVSTPWTFGLSKDCASESCRYFFEVKIRSLPTFSWTRRIMSRWALPLRPLLKRCLEQWAASLVVSGQWNCLSLVRLSVFFKKHKDLDMKDAHVGSFDTSRPSQDISMLLRLLGSMVIMAACTCLSSGCLGSKLKFSLMEAHWHKIWRHRMIVWILFASSLRIYIYILV